MKKLLLLLFLVSLSSLAFATTITIDFEQYASYTQITNQYAGVNFTNALQLVAPYYDYFEVSARVFISAEANLWAFSVGPA